MLKIKTIYIYILRYEEEHVQSVEIILREETRRAMDNEE
tara:strand:+ start:167 stop:283 length:117 start_codon:yes stop_codon:yes gene_type:complete